MSVQDKKTSVQEKNNSPGHFIVTLTLILPLFLLTGCAVIFAPPAPTGVPTLTPAGTAPMPQERETAIASATSTVTPAATITLTVTATPIVSPTLTPPTTPTAPTTTQLTVQRSANVRSGPGVTYAILGGARPGMTFAVTGRNQESTWWQITFNGKSGWIWADLAVVTGLEEVPVMPTPIPPPTPAATATRAPGSSEPTPRGTVTVYESRVTLPTYPYENYQSDAFNPDFNWPYKRFDRERFRLEKPSPQPRSYRLLVLENEFLKLTILPELGGRLWQAIHKPTGANMFYQNPVVKPSPWGPGEQLGWLALGGLEWNLPVEEHGYDWGVAWTATMGRPNPGLAEVTVTNPDQGRWLRASVTIRLRAGSGSFEIVPVISNVGPQTLDFRYWQNAMLAPGLGNKPGAGTHFLFPTESMTVHSTGDARMPQPQQPFSWPLYGGQDVSQLGSWNQYLGFFERPAAHGPFVAVYDTGQDAGAVRVFPAGVARGSKLFSLGFTIPIPSDNFTDDASAYVEVHGGLAPTFWDTAQLSAGGSVSWTESWYPVFGIGDLAYADAVAAIHPYPTGAGLAVGVYSPQPLAGELVASLAGQEVGRQRVQIGPETPFNGLLAPAQKLPASGTVTFRLLATDGQERFRYIYSGPLQ